MRRFFAILCLVSLVAGATVVGDAPEARAADIEQVRV